MRDGSETVGHEVIVHARVAEQLLIAKLGPRRIPAFCEVLELRIDSDAVQLFDPATELRIDDG